ncbi:glycosyltransferase family 1 protein [Fodinisporobacter ferrooxydans]|uniref:Glycosyltransferase family 1 protein n=1 Tax=Fodinisporobacter ferrooxydans TaxID=2901836 RepID=A0ABY4CJT8_9BACL|nr:glycosyltransferase family 1 protein [Alicyclobacillaceae bacterium MYW30-H2]
MKKVGLVMRKIQFGEAQGPRVWADRLKQIGHEIGVDIVFISPERHVSSTEVLPGYEFEKSDLVNYDIVLDKIRSEKIEHVIYTVAGFSFLKLFIPNAVLFPHSFPDPELANSEMMTPFYQMVEKAIVQTEFLKERIVKFGVNDVTVIPIGVEDELAMKHYDPNKIVPNRVVWIGRDESNRRPDLVVDYARQNPQVEIYMVFGGLRYRESMKRFSLPSNLHLRFGLSRDEVFELMNTSKVYWSCSRFDTFAMPLAEALSMGKLIVKPEHPCYRHISSRHVYAGNEENWFDLLNMALAHPLQVSDENRQYAFDHFSTVKMKEGYRDFFAKWLK